MTIENFVIGITAFFIVAGFLVAIDNFSDIDPPSGPFDGFQ